MTDKEMKNIKSERKRSCISMINSILAYNWYHQTAEEIMRMQENSYHNYLENYVKDFGRIEVVKMIQEQMDSIKEIKRNTYIDSEGCSYNTIIWKDPYKDEKEVSSNMTDEKIADETIKNWLIMMYEREIKESKAAISNEHLWEIEYETEKLHGYNPHTENITRLNEYIELLKKYIKDLEDSIC